MRLLGLCLFAVVAIGCAGSGTVGTTGTGSGGIPPGAQFELRWANLPQGQPMEFGGGPYVLELFRVDGGLNDKIRHPEMGHSSPFVRMQPHPGGGWEFSTLNPATFAFTINSRATKYDDPNPGPVVASLAATFQKGDTYTAQVNITGPSGPLTQCLVNFQMTGLFGWTEPLETGPAGTVTRELPVNHTAKMWVYYWGIYRTASVNGGPPIDLQTTPYFPITPGAAGSTTTYNVVLSP